MAGLCSPPPTLRLAPHDARRMTRGQCGSLRLHCEGLSPSTPCRSPGAQWVRFANCRSAPLADRLLPFVSFLLLPEDTLLLLDPSCGLFPDRTVDLEGA